MSLLFQLWGLVACLAGLSIGAQLQVHDASFATDYRLHVSSQQSSIACRSRLSAVVNGSIPGPQLTLYEDQTTWVRVYNDMDTQNLTMHWHGLSQSVAQFSDGTPQASQWPIPPGHFFDYEIHPARGEAGTYFYHSHVGFQANTAAGPLIVKERNEAPPFEYSDEKILFLSELWNRTDDQVIAGLTAPTAAQFSWTGDAEVLLVNGNGYEGFDANQTNTAPPWSPPPSTPQTCRPEVIEVRPDTTYRFRAIGGLALSPTTFGFEDHGTLEVIAADASYTQPAETDHIQVGPGQRIDFLFKTKSAAELRRLGKTQFWMQIQNQYRPVLVTSYAVISYIDVPGASNTPPPSPPKTTPVTLSPNGSSWLEYTLRPLKPNGFPSASEVTRTVHINSAQLQDQQAGVFWTASNRTWTETDEHLGGTPYFSTAPNVGNPYLVDIYEHGENAIPDFAAAVANGGYDAQRNVYAAEVGEVIDIVLTNEANDKAGGFDGHPWHIHGGHIYDLGSGQGAYDAAANEEKLKGYTPVMRDTTYLYKYVYDDGIGTVPKYTAQGWRAWRLRVDKPGVWMVHCHILQHMIMGMQTVWVMGNASQITANSEPYVQGYLDYGGSAYGNSSYDPLVLHEYD